MSVDGDDIPVRARQEYRRSVEKWNQVTKKDGITKSGNDWILQALDGFHDSQLKPTDYPDGPQGKLVIYHPTLEVNVAKPPNLASGATWDFHLTTQPFYGGTDSLVGFNASINTAGASLGAVGNGRGSTITMVTNDNGFVAAPVIMDRRPSGDLTFTSGGSVAALNYGCVDIPKQYTEGPTRVVGMAVEVVNTTPELYRGGRVDAYELPMRPIESDAVLCGLEQNGAEVFYNNLSSGNSASPVYYRTPARVVAVAQPPSRVAQAALPDNSLYWPAKHGGYFNAVFEKPPPMSAPNQIWPAWYAGDPAVGNVPQVYNGPWPSAYPGNGSLARRLVAWNVTNSPSPVGLTPSSPYEFHAYLNRIGVIPISRKGLYFTGLSEQTTLSVRVRFYIVRIPSINEPDIYNLALPPPKVDRRVWELYAEIVSKLPVACRFDENPLGEWFKDVLGTVARWAPTVGNLVGTVVPGASLLGQGIGKAAEVLTKETHEDAKEKHAQKEKDLLIERLKQQLKAMEQQASSLKAVKAAKVAKK
jgi:hypothetical protein